NKDGSNYDCVVPVGGGKDSYFIMHIVTKILKLNPLLVTFNEQYNTKKGIRNLANLLTKFDCDHIQYTIDPGFAKRIVKASMKKNADMYWHCNAGSNVFPVQMAVKFNIPLIIWGAHPLVESVGMFSHHDFVEMSRKTRKEHYVRGHEQLIDDEYNITEKDMKIFEYPSDEEIEKVGVRGIYLNNFFRWDSQKQHEDMIRLYGYESGEQERTFNPYENVHCLYSDGVHDYLKFLKFGFGRATDHACRDIRLKRMTREKAIELIQKYDYKKPEDLKIFLDWIGMSETEFYGCVDPFRDPKAWEKVEGKWKLKDPIIDHVKEEGIDDVRLQKIEERKYILTVSPESDEKDDKPYLLGRGYLDKRNFRAVTD
ncbi:MAG: N-acetyl sugar amidotransferase, partial [Bacteroidetes bacterium]|nr:N-acetyl sugar amidotransferase [Bacteroidota bacterium]